MEKPNGPGETFESPFHKVMAFARGRLGGFEKSRWIVDSLISSPAALAALELKLKKLSEGRTDVSRTDFCTVVETAARGLQGAQSLTRADVDNFAYALMEAFGGSPSAGSVSLEALQD